MKFIKRGFRKHCLYVCLCLFFVAHGMGFAQNVKPKVALVLSGGGAKGLAHIPVLQMLDSLGIVPDLVVGTSMGSIVGGLYAMGYSGDSIASIANTADWNKLLSGTMAMSVVGVDEKSEYNRYLVDFDIVKGRPKPKSAILNDQNLREFLAYLIYPVFNVNNFDSLAIPYRAVATDILNGKEVILDKGYLSFAMRASMSIPSIFKPVPYDTTLLVDGGILNNFPTDVAKSLGADIIIGSDVGGEQESIENLDNIVSLLFQSSMIISNMKNPANRRLCDILINHAPNLTYSTQDFGRNKEIYDEGKIATLENREAMIALAEKLKPFPCKTPSLPHVKGTVTLDTIIYNNIDSNNLELLMARTNLKAHQDYSTSDLIDGLNRAMGTQLFSQITFNPIIKDNGIELELNGFEKSKHQIKGAMHYDSYKGVGILVNYTGRNILGKASRFIASADLAKQPRIRLQNQKSFGAQKNWWWRSEVYGQHIEQKYYIKGEAGDNVDQTYLLFENQINRNLNAFKCYFGLGLKLDYSYLKPTVNPSISDNVYHLSSYNFSNLEFYVHYVMNTMDKVYYPRWGTKLKLKAGRSLVNNVDMDYYKDLLPDNVGSTNGFSKLTMEFEKRISRNKTTAIFGLSAGYILLDERQADEVSFLENGQSAKFFFGGNIARPMQNDYIFPGLHEGELILSQFTMVDLGLQFNPLSNMYFTPHVNMASVGFKGFDDYVDNVFTSKGNWKNMVNTSGLMSAGINTSYNSFLGPVNFDVSWVNNINKVRYSLSIGIHFNRSN